ncbi:MAG: hypothetical protein Q4G07_01200 [Oscillospiraceae bacterium]|nr:hypothetical protein [Oscillospiraceae bacterium]
MDDNMEMLSVVAETAWMGHNTLLQLQDMTQNEAFKAFLRIQLKAYDIVLNETRIQYEARGEQLPEESTWNKMMTFMGIKIDTMMDKSTRHIADMLIQGSNQGIMELTKANKDYPGAEAPVKSLAEKLLVMLERNVEELKTFL